MSWPRPFRAKQSPTWDSSLMGPGHGAVQSCTFSVSCHSVWMGPHRTEHCDCLTLCATLRAGYCPEIAQMNPFPLVTTGGDLRHLQQLICLSQWGAHCRVLHAPSRLICLPSPPTSQPQVALSAATLPRSQHGGQGTTLSMRSRHPKWQVLGVASQQDCQKSHSSPVPGALPGGGPGRSRVKGSLWPP